MRASLLALAMSCLPVAYSLDSTKPEANVHGEMTREALAGILAPSNLQAVTDANQSQDALNSEAAAEKRRHCDGSNLRASVQYINRETSRALNSAVESDSELQSRSDALRHLGLMIHCAQDFYLRSNYVELNLEAEEHKTDPYNIPLVDWAKVPEGISGATSGTKLTAAKDADLQDVLRKDSATTNGGKIVVSPNVTYYSIARELAVRETQRQWSLFETILRSRCGDRAPAVIAALRKAAPPTAAQTALAKEKEGQTIVGDPQDSSPDNPNSDELEPKDIQ